MRNRRAQILGARPRRSGFARTGRRGAASETPQQRGPAPLPIDARAIGEESELGLERTSRLADVTAQQRDLEDQYGFGAGASNPYSDAARLARERDAGQRGALNTAGNQIYAGSTINKERGVAAAYDRNRQALEASYNSKQDQLGRTQAETGQAYQLGLGRIKEGALERALSSEPAPLAVGNGRQRTRRRRR